MKKAVTMYRSITATKFDTKGVFCPAEGEDIIKRMTLEYLYAKDFILDGNGVAVEGGQYYPAIVYGSQAVDYKCTMTESDFVKHAEKVDSRFVNGRTRMVTRSVSAYTATCLCYDMEKQTMINSAFSIPEDRGAEKNLTYLKKYNEVPGKFIIATVLNVTETEGIYAMTERKFFELSTKEEATE